MSILLRKNNRSLEAGFSVIELAIVVAIAAILASMSLIIFGKTRAHYELVNNARNFVAHIERARSLAIKYNQTLKLGFTSENTTFGLTCTDCSEPINELRSMSVPATITLSAHPTITIKGNGTIQSTEGTIVIADGQGREVPITISNSGRTTIGEVTE
ncbi:MAG TPA: GspH/FimT family pseudopilin [Blastocatellia bacterium]|nr:GspH/FimT family pseudopilin [Blastocatellia bacterium]